MPFAAVLDAGVLYPLPLRDTLLRIAETELYDAYWSERILDEVVRNLVADGRATDDRARRLTDAMAAAFDGAAVPQDAVDRLEPAMTNDEKDRHVLAAAVVSDAQAIVTLNLKDLPVEACEPFAIEPLHPDVFLLDLYSLDPNEVYEAVERQAAVLRRPPMSLDELVGRLAVTVPEFAARLRDHTPSS
jgi:predicted nucleic acid-binding protein